MLPTVRRGILTGNLKKIAKRQQKIQKMKFINLSYSLRISYDDIAVCVMCGQATIERQEVEFASEKSQLDNECIELRRQLRDLKDAVMKDSETWQNDRMSLCRQLQLVHSLTILPFR